MDENDAITDPEVTTEPPDAPETPTPTETMFSQAEVDRMIKDRLARDRRSRNAKQRSKAVEKTEDAEPGDPRWSDGSWRDDFYDAIDGYTLTRSQRRRLRDSFKREQPDDPDAWVNDWCEDFGISNGEAPEAAAPEPSTNESVTTEPPPLPASDKGTPSAGRDWDTILDPFALTSDDIKRMEAKHGKRQAQRKIRLMAERWGKGRSVS